MSILVMNSNTFAVSEYSQAWTDAVFSNGVLHGIDATGMWAPDQDGTDKPAYALRTGDLELSGGMPFSLFKATPNIRVDHVGKLALYRSDRGADKTSGPFNVNSPDRDKLREWPIDTGRGHSGTRYALEFTGTGKFSLSSVALYIKPLSRRR